MLLRVAMALRDTVCTELASLEYAMGTLVARGLLRGVGSGCRIHASVRYLQPTRIVVGSGCEIRAGTILDGRSSSRPSINIGDGCRIKDHVSLACYGGSITLGTNVLVGRCATIFGHGGVRVGDDSMLGPMVTVVSDEYLSYLEHGPFQAQGFTRSPIEIGSNVWIGGGVTILAGVSIGSDSVVGAGSVVNSDLPSCWLSGGVPAKPVRRLGSDRPPDVRVCHRDWGLLE